MPRNLKQRKRGKRHVCFPPKALGGDEMAWTVHLIRWGRLISLGEGNRMLVSSDKLAEVSIATGFIDRIGFSEFPKI